MYFNRRTIRLENFDYSNNGYYFVTICAWKHLTIFGKIIDNLMILNDNGKIIENELIKTEIMRKNVKLIFFKLCQTMFI